MQVFESGSGKWVKVNPDQGDLIFTSDKTQATKFTDLELRSADQFFWEFSVYKKTMHAVPPGTNQEPHDCQTVKTYLKDLLELD